MTHDDALAALAAHPHIRRYRELCAEDNPDAEARDAWRVQIVRIARGEHPAPPAVAVSYGERPAASPCRSCR